MKKSIDKLADEIIAKHRAYKPASEQTIQRHERRIGYHLPEDMKQFYRRCNGAALSTEGLSPVIYLLPLSQIKRTRIYIYGQDDDTYVPSSWYAIVDLMDGNYIGADLATVNKSACTIIDCFHETHGVPDYDEIIALSFTEFLRNLLKYKGQPYWLDKKFRIYGPAVAKAK